MMHDCLSAWLPKMSPLGLIVRENCTPYFCTPRDAEILGWAGVDGIHYCKIPQYGEMIFAVSPMNLAPDYVQPIAENGEDLLRLLLAVSDMGVLEQAWQWDSAQFDAFLQSNPPDPEQSALLEEIARTTSLTPMENPWLYLVELRLGFCGVIPFSDEYYETTGEEPPLPWSVVYGKGFFPGESEAKNSETLPLSVSFRFAEHDWMIPAIYNLPSGIVVDFCMRIEPDAIRSFIEKWDRGDDVLSPEEEILRNNENPTCVPMRPTLICNGKVISAECGHAAYYNPVMPEASGSRAAQILAHYGLSPDCGWMFWRSAFRILTKRIRHASLRLEADPVTIPGERFTVEKVGDTLPFRSPIDGTSHTLTVTCYEETIVPVSRYARDELPDHLVEFSYRVTPDMPPHVLQIHDCCSGDSPRPRNGKPCDFASTIAVLTSRKDTAPEENALGIIGGADGPSAVFIGNRRDIPERTVASSLYFSCPKPITWRLDFLRKPFPDAEVSLIEV